MLRTKAYHEAFVYKNIDSFWHKLTVRTNNVNYFLLAYTFSHLSLIDSLICRSTFTIIIFTGNNFWFGLRLSRWNNVHRYIHFILNHLYDSPPLSSNKEEEESCVCVCVCSSASIWIARFKGIWLGSMSILFSCGKRVMPANNQYRKTYYAQNCDCSTLSEELKVRRRGQIGGKWR